MAISHIKFSTFVMLLLAVVANNRVTADIACSDAIGRISPCELFLLGLAGSPDIGCCSAVASLGQIAAASQPDLKALCRCFKDAAKSAPINLGNAAHLPQLCNVSVGVPIDPNVDCDSI